MKTKRERHLAANHYALMAGMPAPYPFPPARKRRASDPLKETEHDIQAALHSRWMLQHQMFGLPDFALFAIRNGGMRSRKQNSKGAWYSPEGNAARAEGLKAGVPDLMLAVRRSNFCGLFMETKRPGGVISPEQISVIAYLRQAGYDCCVYYSADEGWDRLVKYLRGII